MDSANLISAGVRVQGAITGTGPLTVAGTIAGSVELAGDLAVSRSGSVEATVSATNIDVQGRVSGRVTAARAVAVGPQGSLDGEVAAASLSIHPDAKVTATFAMTLDLPRSAR